MKGLFAVVLTIFFALAGGGVAFADSAPSCSTSQLVCLSLEFLGADAEDVVHPCTTFDAEPGAWVCPNTEEGEFNKDNQLPLQPSSGNNFRDMMGQ